LTVPRLEDLDLSDFDFLDLGCSRGGSIRQCAKRFGASRGLGIDQDSDKVLEALDAGLDAALGDATSLELDGQARFVSMMDFLEHLPSLEMVERTLASAAAAATDFVYVFHPSFEGEDYLGELGLRQYWWHWKGHRCHPTVADYCAILDRQGLHDYMVRYLGPIHSSDHESIIPSTAPVDQHSFDRQTHGPKPSIVFPRAIWRAQEIFIALRPLPAGDWARITAPRDGGSD